MHRLNNGRLIHSTYNIMSKITKNDLVFNQYSYKKAYHNLMYLLKDIDVELTNPCLFDDLEED
jgi:hypothetical protein